MRRLHPDPVDAPALETLYDAARSPRPDRPHVLVNMVASVDGAFAVEGSSKALASPGDQWVFHLLRSLPDVILVGAGTARTEGYGPPMVDAQRQTRRVANGQAAQPTIALVTRSVHLDLTSSLFTRHRPIVICPAGAATAELREVAEVIEAGDGEVDLTAALRQLRRQGVGIVLAEGGPSLNGELARRGLVDEFCLTVRSILAGGSSTGILGRMALPSPLTLELAQLLEDGGDLFCRYLVRS